MLMSVNESLGTHHASLIFKSKGLNAALSLSLITLNLHPALHANTGNYVVLGWESVSDEKAKLQCNVLTLKYNTYV